ncbi:MAG: hypothetical protein KKA79_10020 [Nanoarchaeota archaeon]|nr:hypothetical protein [Nanoarchaeota archaeon]MCG2718713.1 hypothetical protein [Nanoarchaeota archaeon]
MKLLEKFKKYAKISLATCMVLPPLLFMGKQALAENTPDMTSPKNIETILEEKDTESSMPEREIILNFENPITNVEANSNAWYSTNQIFGKFNDLLGEELELDDHPLGRIGLLALAFYRSKWIGLSSHEFAHIRVGQKFGEYPWDFEMNSFFNIGNNWSKRFEYYPTDEELMQERIAGLNQDEHNAYTLTKNNLDNLTFDNAMVFLRSKFWDLKYNINSGEEKNVDDVEEYIRLLNKKEINLSKKEFLVHSLLADLASSPDSIRTLWNYIINGDRTTERMKLDVLGVEFTMPLVNHYLTPDGSYFNITFTCLNGENPIEINIGTDVDFLGGGEVDHLRLGGQYNNLKLIDKEQFPTLSPFIYINTDKSFDYKGFSIGTEADLAIFDTLSLTGKFDYSKNDIMENTVKGKEEGFNFYLGIKKSF